MELEHAGSAHHVLRKQAARVLRAEADGAAVPLWRRTPEQGVERWRRSMWRVQNW